ncbi:MAG: hypothetical protein HOQ07_00160 [Sinomonas sp.]|nr:hypothetical protein [Sinomonas sp.]
MSATQGAAALVLLDEYGEFRLYGSETDLLRSHEEPESTRCVIDRLGQYLHLQRDPLGRLALSRPLGPADHLSLLQQFRREQHRHPDDHRLLRRYPATREQVLDTIFEELEAEDPADAHTWTVETGHGIWLCQGLGAVDARVAQSPDPALVTDPYGHSYRPHTLQHGAVARRLHGRPLYVELTRQPAPRRASRLLDISQ